MSSIDAKRAHAELGWSFTPLSGKRPTAKGWQTAPRETTKDLEQWIAQGSNIGLRTGRNSGIVVIDEDTAKGGDVAALNLPPTVTVETGGGGRHFYFRCDRTIGNSAGKLGKGIDVRGEGGQVVFPGSIHPATGAVYEWAPGSSPWERDVAALPAEIVERLTAKSAPPASGGAASNGSAQRGLANFIYQSELRNVASAADGERNDTLNRAAFTLGRLVAGGSYDHADIRGDLISAGVSAGLNPRECEATVASGMEAGMQNPRDLQAERRSTPRGGAAVNTNGRIVRFGLEDIGAAERFVDQHGEDVRFVPETGWRHYNGTFWEADNDGFAMRCAKSVARSIYSEAGAVTDDDLAEKLAKFAAKTSTKPRLDAMLALVPSEPGMTRAIDAFDRDPALLCCNNCVVDLRTGEQRPHDRNLFQSMCTHVDYVPDARSDLWDAFLDRILAGNKRLIGFVQRAAGYSATGETGERCLFPCWGGGKNGKSTFIETIAHALGDYATVIPAIAMMATRNDSGASPEIAGLRGKRLAISSETGEGRRFNEERIKALTGGDTIAARHLYHDYFNFRPVAKFWLSTNHKPVVTGTDDAIWDRLRLIHFGVRIPEDERDGKLPDKLREVMGAVLAWVVQGAVAWHAGGLQPPPEVLDATAEYRSEMDLLGDFLDDVCIVDPAADVAAGDVFAAYRAWCESGNLKAMSRTMFGRKLTERGFEPDQSPNGDRIRLGLQLRGGANS